MPATNKQMRLSPDDIQMIGEFVQNAENSILAKVATKQDLQSFATKQDLQSFATKQDLQSFATKQDMKSLVRKVDLESIIEDVVGRVVEDKFKKIIGIFPKREEFHTQMATQALTVQRVEQEQVVLTHQTQLLDKRVTRLERRQTP